MCEANAYLKEADKETLLMEAVDKVEPDENGIRLVSISGSEIHQGTDPFIVLVDHKVFILPE